MELTNAIEQYIKLSNGLLKAESDFDVYAKWFWVWYLENNKIELTKNQLDSIENIQLSYDDGEYSLILFIDNFLPDNAILPTIIIFDYVIAVISYENDLSGNPTIRIDFYFSQEREASENLFIKWLEKYQSEIYSLIKKDYK